MQRLQWPRVLSLQCSQANLLEKGALALLKKGYKPQLQCRWQPDSRRNLPAHTIFTPCFTGLLYGPFNGPLPLCVTLKVEAVKRFLSSIVGLLWIHSLANGLPATGCGRDPLLQAARCSAEQQTIQNPVSTKSPTQARQKENLPKLDDSGPGGGPGRGDDGGGGGGGGGGGWAGGFALWGFLLLLSFIKEKEKDKPYRRDAFTKSRVKKMREAYL
ncbi:hypothetical protein GOP47_0015402 [Adiantum capillus-veneris]|uniref:Uncharacterized protein n=1 Tax=Adiantum capillus-veneris TaxID=13818 RepID=A0A9D4ZDY6_ADICA|nr:hypothetical protein GOP47_0015402 [Adiantum capillus-veneris]